MGFALPQATVSPGLETISTIGPSFFEYLSFLCDLSSWRPSLLPFSIISYLWQVEVSFKRVLQILSIHPYFFFKNASFHSFLPSSPMTVYDKTKKNTCRQVLLMHQVGTWNRLASSLYARLLICKVRKVLPPFRYNTCHVTAWRVEATAAANPVLFLLWTVDVRNVQTE